MKKEYIIISDADEYSFTSKVKYHLNEGYSLAGGLSVLLEDVAPDDIPEGGESKVVVFYQAVYK